jgi:hypothetical protein
LISACASWAQAIEDGPQMPAEPLIGNEQADDEIGALLELLAAGRGAPRAERRRRGLRADHAADRRMGHRDSHAPAARASGL